MPKQIRLDGALIEVCMTTFGLPRELRKRVKLRAAEEDISSNELVIKALIAYLKTKGGAK